MRSDKFLVCLLLLPMATACAASPRLLEQLRSDHAALVSAEQDFHGRVERGTLRGAGMVDYAAYVARLHRQVAEDCAALATSGIPVPSDISCPAGPAVLSAPASVDQAGERTAAEKTTDLDAELFNGLGEFDEMLLREQQRIKAAAPRAAGGDGGQGGNGTATAAGAGASGYEQQAGGSSTYGAGAGPGASQQQGNNGAPPGTPNGNDDDVVARQLREAAENEPDPVLKKKIWEEYRKYKEGTY